MNTFPHSFVIDFGMKGYRAGLDKVWDKDEKLAYDRWKGVVRMLANTAGAPDVIEPGVEIEIVCLIHWKKKARIDGSNILKAVEDALYKRDRDLAAGIWRRTQNTGEDRIEVTVIVNRNG